MEFELLYHERAGAMLSDCERDLVIDLKIDILLREIAKEDDFLYTACESVLAHPLVDLLLIMKRQAVLQDAIINPNFFETLYTLSTRAVLETTEFLEFTKPKYDKVIPNAKKIVTETEMAKIILKYLIELESLLDCYANSFKSDDLRKLQAEVKHVLKEDYITCIKARINELASLKAGSGVVISGHIGQGLKEADVVLNRITDTKRENHSLLKKLFIKPDETAIPLDNITLIKNSQEMVESSLKSILREIVMFNRSALAVFVKLRYQIGFYTGCQRLYQRLFTLGVTVCFPNIQPGYNFYESVQLMDVGLALMEKKPPVGNNIYCLDKQLWVITGTNQGGKTTFLRSVGLAQVMTQCGMFVTAERHICNLHPGIYTHFPNGEDSSMSSGLFEVELRKLDALINNMQPGSMLLMNESFATTTQREASHLAEEVTRALRETGIVTLFVTHLFEYADKLWRQKPGDVIFYRAIHNEDSRRFFYLEEGAPLKTSFGLDLFEQVMR